MVPGRTYLDCLNQYETSLKMPLHNQTAQFSMKEEIDECQDVPSEVNTPIQGMNLTPTLSTKMSIERMMSMNEMRTSKYKSISMSNVGSQAQIPGYSIRNTEEYM